MSTLTNEIIQNLEQQKLIFNPFLFSYSKYDVTDIEKQDLPNIDNKQLYLNNNRSDYDFVIGTKFNVVFRRGDVRSYQKVDAELDFASLKKGDNIGVIPRGYGGIVRLTFKDKIPEIINFMIQNDREKYDDSKNDIIYFTTQEVMGKILEELDKIENI